MRTLRLLLICGLGLTSCSEAIDDTVDDAEAESDMAVDLGKADANDLTGLYRWSSASKPYWNNDVPSLQLAGARYIRSRCYGHDCATLVPQTGDHQVVRTSGGKVYLRFMSFTRTWNGDEWIEKPALADTYEVTKTSNTIKLRKTYSSRWFTLAKVSEKTACTASGGHWGVDGPGTCACDHVTGSDWSHYVGFFPGLGGCFEIFAADEDGCSSTGSYTDDDGTAIGTYCNCPLGTHETQAGCEAI